MVNVKSIYKPKIVFLSRLFYPHIGGVENHVTAISEELITNGYRIYIITEKYDKSLKDYELHNGVTIYRISYPKWKYIGLMILWVKIFKFLPVLLMADIIHAHDVFLWLLPFKVIFPFKKIYLTIHGWEGIYPIPKFQKITKKVSAFLSTKVIIVGKYISSTYGIQYDDITYGFVKLNSNKVIQKDQKLFLFLGRLDQDTGLPVFLHLAPQLIKNNFRIIFCGDGKLKNVCKKFGEVMGFCDPVPYLLKANYCFATGYLSIIEGLYYKCHVLVGYDNQLKKSYYYDAPFSKWLLVLSSDDIKDHNIDYLLNKKVWHTGIAREWSKTQNIKHLTNKYLSLWH